MTDHEADEALSPGTEDEGQRDSAAKTSYKRYRKNRKVFFAVAGVIAVVGLILFIVGLVLVVKSRGEGKKHPVSSEQENDNDNPVDKCSFSSEAKRAGQRFNSSSCVETDKFDSYSFIQSSLFIIKDKFYNTNATVKKKHQGALELEFQNIFILS